jgi:iron complex outermembrane receptor protein
MQRNLLLAGASLVALFTSGNAFAQEASTWAGATSQVDEIVVTGSRGRPRTVQDSPVPIDVLSAEDIQSTGFSDTNDVLRALVPSYSVSREPNSDAGTFVRPATLRGLPGDKTLLLVNSKRRHRSAAVNAFGFGSQAADSATIPASAVRSIEVLRDGAAAQYGSDAVAGVINFLLREDSSGGSMSARIGQYYEGDGDDYFLSGNIGLPLTENGFVNASVEFNRAGQTSRGGPFCNSTFCAATYAETHPEYAALVDPDEPLSKIGQPSLEAVRSFVNAGIDLNDDTRLYAFGNYSRSDTLADATYRYPAAGQTTLDVPVRLADGTIFLFSEQFPGGFTPRYSAVITDYSLVSGIKGVFGVGSGVSYDFSARYGENQMRYYIENTVNPSIGPGSPREFMRANYVADEAALNADFAYDWATPFLSGPLTTAFGLEYRREGFAMEPGEAAAYAAGPFATRDPFGFCATGATAPAGVDCANPRDPVYNTLPTLTLSVSPQTADDVSRDSYAGYFEASADLTERLFVTAAARYEDFSDFGDTFNSKLAARFAITPDLALRGSIGTGFRAPTPGQQSFSNVQLTSSDGFIVLVGLFPVNNPVSQFLGAQRLRPEESFNLTAGITADLMGVNLSFDLYQIKVDDQFYSTSQIAVTPAIRQAMIDAGVSGAEGIGRVQFFQNALDTTASGFDIVATDRFNWGNGQSTSLTLSLNYNKYEIDAVKIANLLDAEAVFDFENGRPEWKANLGVVHDIGRFTLSARGNLYGPYKNMFSVANPVVQEFDPELIVDLDVAYQIDERHRISVGARNIFDNYPARDEIGEGTANGAIYRNDSPVDWQGGFVFVRLDATF